MISTRPLQRFRPRPTYPSPMATSVSAVSQAISAIAPGAEARPPITTAGRTIPASRLRVLLLMARLTPPVACTDRACRVPASAVRRARREHPHGEATGGRQTNPTKGDAAGHDRAESKQHGEVEGIRAEDHAEPNIFCARQQGGDRR